jgi:curved DNA-binding protein CbpA
MTQEPPPSCGLALLAQAFRSKRTGLLVLGEGTAELRVRLEAGQVVALGPAPAEAAVATPMPKPNDSVRLRLERVLSEIGMRRPAPSAEPPIVPPPGSLRDRLIERLADESQPVHFEEGSEAPQNLVAVAVATEPLILEAVRQMRHADVVRDALGDLDQRLVATTALADERTLTLTEGYLLSRIDGLLSTRQVLQLVPLDPQETERTLLGLMLTGRVVGRPAPAARHPARPAAAQAAAEPPAAQPERVDGPAPAVETEPAPRAEDSARAAEAVAEPIIEAVAEPTAEAVAEPIAESVTEPVVEAYAEPIVEALPDDEVAETAAAEGPTVPLPIKATQRFDGAMLERRREIRDFFLSLHVKNHFEVLGVEPGCSDAEVRQAYMALAKRYHPDAQRDKRLEDLHDFLEAIFIRVGEAWEVLGEAKSRASYEARSGIVRRPRTTPQGQAASSAAPETPPVPATASASQEPGGYVPPEEILFKARRLLAQARYWDAIQMLETALPAMEPRSQQHRGRLLLARAYSKNPNWLRRAEEVLQEMMREDPTNADAYYELGLVYKTGGFVARAHGMFRRALELRPGHKQASAELGIQADEAGGSGGGLLKRLFKRGKAS